MPDRFTIEYRTLLRVAIRHDAWLSRGGVPLERLTAAQQEQVAAGYDIGRLFRLVPTADTDELMGRHALRLRRTATGFSVVTRVRSPQGAPGPVMDRPLPAATRLRFLLLLVDAALPDYSNLPLTRGRSFYRFGTAAANVDALGAHLSAPLAAFDPQRRYRLGDLVLDSLQDPSLRRVALRDTGPGALQAADWSPTAPLPPADPGPFNPGQINTGDRIQRGGFVFEAVRDDPGNDVTVAADWRRLFPISLQGASSADRIPLRPPRFDLDVAAAAVRSVHLELRDEHGRHLEWRRFSAADPLPRISVDIAGRAPGAYRMRLVDDAGAPLRDGGGQSLAVADQAFYLDAEAEAASAFGVIEVGAADPGYALLNPDGTLIAPTFLLRLLSRRTVWRYHFPRDLSAAEIAAIPAGLVQDGPRGLRTVDVHPLGADFVTLGRFDSGQLLPNPAPDQPLAFDAGDLVSDVHLNH